MNTITIAGRRWFDKVNGNTYHSVDVWLNGTFLDRVPFEYGYDDSYKQTAFSVLHKHGILADVTYYHRDKIEDLGYAVISTVSDVSRKKDL